METKWTPGPWRVEGDWNVGTDKITIVSGSIMVKDDAESVANAHLIAAAPDLYAALAPLIVIALDNLDGMDPETREEFERDISVARAALAKARGEA